MVGVALPLIIALASASFILLYFAFQLNNEHTFLKLLNIGFALIFLVLIAKTTIDYEDNCDLLLNETALISEIVENTTTNISTISTNTSYTYDYVCEDTTNNTPTLFVEYTGWYWRLFAIYLLLFVIYIFIVKKLKNEIRFKK